MPLSRSRVSQIILYAICSPLVAYWLSKVNSITPGPYLDEVFHVRQAQTYWNGQWTTWDPKITTPPGLYLWSYLLLRPLKIFCGDFALDAAKLRATNALALGGILPLLLVSTLRLIWRQDGSSRKVEGSQGTRGGGAKVRDGREWSFNHVALNICLFPPLFFFSGLYYTDVMSALVVLAAYRASLKHQDGSVSDDGVARRQKSSFVSITSPRVGLWLLGLLSLLFRQTNIFWVSIYLAGNQIVHILKSSGSKECTSSKLSEIVSSAWNRGDLYDPAVEEASVEDYVKTIISIAVACSVHLSQILEGVGVHVSFLISFGMFVLWNGSVVLGHKEFHSAGVHLPQMLYIWPYIAFFSWPSMLPVILNLIQPKDPASIASRWHRIRSRSPRVLVTIIPILLTMTIVVRYNTIIHPFTLADNRHYVFYIFRIFRLCPPVKYLAIPVYFTCAWLAIITLGDLDFFTTKDAKGTNPRQLHRKPPIQPPPPPPVNNNNNSGHAESSGNRISLVIIWLVSTALSLVTAPLVEPRYFILPWLIWRLHVPMSVSAASTSASASASASSEHVSSATLRSQGSQLWLETVWFLLINLVTGQVFLHRGFEWPQEPGNVQRFLW